MHKATNNVLPLPLLRDQLVSSETLSRTSATSTDVHHFFKVMVDDALQGIMIHRSHKPFYVNRAWAELHDMTVDEVMAMPTLLDLIHPSEIERLRGYAAKRLAGGDLPTRYRYRGLRKNGQPFWVEQFVRVIDWGGERFIQSTFIDVDDQERQANELRQRQQMMEQEVRESTEALISSNQQLHIHQSVIDQMSERISVVGTDYRFRMTNQANADFRQRSRDEFIGVHVRETVGDAWFEETAKGMFDAAFAGQARRRARWTVSPAGEQLYIEVTCEPFRDRDGTISGAITSIRDNTVAKEAEDQLRLFASVVEQVGDRISVIDLSYRYRMTNRAYLDFHQMPQEKIMGHHVAELVGDCTFQTFAKPDLDRCFNGETVKARRTIKNGKGEDRVLDILLEPYREANGIITGAVTITRDVTEAHQLSERLAYQARYDQLTGLVNRRAFELLLEKSIEETSAGSRSDALCFIDLDQFKIVNDTVGHLVGDQLLQQVAKHLAGKLNRDDALARLGGDEFGLLLRGCSLRRAKRAAEQLISTLKDLQFLHDDLMFEVGASIGITAINRHATSAIDVMAEADLACYAAKDNGRNRVQIYKKRDVVMRQRREDMYRAGGIRAALDRDRFVLFGQPIRPVTENDDSGPDCVEILLRMKGDRGRLIMPSAFIPAAERYGFMADVDRWVIRKTVAELVRPGTSLAGIDVCINLSGVTLNDETALDFIRQTMTLSNLPPELVSFEITETAAVRNIAKTRIFMDELREMGYRFALDDFGSGVSSLTYLKRLPVDFLKIDGTFIRDISKDHGSQAMVKAISQMAKDIGIKTVAEGVEDPSTLDALMSLGIDYVQGFAIGRPTPLGAPVKACN